MTKPLSPQTTSEEFKIYLANIQMLQNASNALNQADLIKLNYIFDNSYNNTTNNDNSKNNQNNNINNENNSVNNMPLMLDVVNSSLTNLEELEVARSSRQQRPSLHLLNTLEESEILTRYAEVVDDILDSLKPGVDEQKSMFRNLHKEFWDLPLNHQEKPMVFGSQAKNRYKTILPNENSRVLLDKQTIDIVKRIESAGDQMEDDQRHTVCLTGEEHKASIPSNEEVLYINANYIKVFIK